MVVRLETGRNANWLIRAFSPPFWPGMETDPPTSGTYPGAASWRDSERTRAARGEGDGDRFPSKVLALRRLLAGKASPSSSSPSSLPGARVLVGRVLVLEERREVAQERVRGEAVGGGPLLLPGRRQVVGDVEEGELLLLLLSFCCLLLLREAGWMDG